MSAGNRYTDRVKRLFAQYNDLRARQYAGDYFATDMLIDMDIALERAELTPKQAQAFRAVYVDGREQKAVAAALGISEPALSYRLGLAIKKLAEVYEAWAYLDEMQSEKEGE